MSQPGGMRLPLHGAVHTHLQPNLALITRAHHVIHTVAFEKILGVLCWFHFDRLKSELSAAACAVCCQLASIEPQPCRKVISQRCTAASLRI